MPSASSPHSAKRKRDPGPKFYAVQNGHRPGVYHSWQDCLGQVSGYKGATFKSFPSLTEAENFVKHGLSSTNGISSKGPEKFYAVRSGRVPGIYLDWPSALKQITGYPKPDHKSFQTRAEADTFMKQGIDSDSVASKQKRQRKSGVTKQGLDIDELDENIEPGMGPLPKDCEDGFDARLTMDQGSGLVQYKPGHQRKATKMVPVGQADNQPLVIYTDGATLDNGRKGASAGVGVYFGPLDSRNVSEPLAGDRQTNQRAELTALKRAIDMAPLNKSAIIYTDSKYSINCVTVWFINWRSNGWQNSHGKPVENRDLIEPIITKIDERFRMKGKTEFRWVKGHANDPGNTAADELAVNAAQEARAIGGIE